MSNELASLKVQELIVKGAVFELPPEKQKAIADLKEKVEALIYAPNDEEGLGILVLALIGIQAAIKAAEEEAEAA